MASAPALEVSEFVVHRGRLRVVDSVSFSVERGQYVGLIGLNGAGKTSLLSAIAGSLPTTSGTARLAGVDVSRAPAWDRCAAGLALVPSRRQLFGGLTVYENLLVGAHTVPKKEHAAEYAKVCELFPILAEKRKQRANELSGGQQQMVAIGRALMAKPSVLILDEPSEGLAPVVVALVFEVLAKLRELSGLSILLAEQNASAIPLCDSLLVMTTGRLAERHHADATDVNDLARAVFGS